MNIRIGCEYVPTVEELIATLPGSNKEIYEDDAEEILEWIADQDAMKPVSAWKELKVTAVREKEVDLDRISLYCPFLAEKLSVGDTIYAAVITAGKELHQMMADLDDIMQEYILGFLMSNILTAKTVDVVEELCQESGLSHVAMIMPGIPEVCAMDQQLQVARMLEEEFKKLEIVVKNGGSLSPTYSSTAFFLLGEGESNVPKDWENPLERNAFGNKLFESAGHS